MPTKYTSPYASAFKSAVRRGTSYNTAVFNIAKRWKKTPEYVWESLYKAGFCYRQKFNGQWIYFPKQVWKFPAATWKTSQFYTWQWFTEWCITSGFCTPEQFYNHCGSQQDFMTYFRKFWGKQYTWKKTKRTRSRKTGTYSFPKTRTRYTRKAA